MSNAALPPGFELQPQTGLGAGRLPGEDTAGGRQVAGRRVDPRQALPRAPAPAQAPSPTRALPPQAAAMPPPQGMGSAALPPGFEVEQAQQQPAPGLASGLNASPPRQVGVAEGVARTIGQSAIPVVRTLGLAASSVAKLFGGDDAQEAVFRKTDEALSSMRQAYQFQQGEEVGTATQVLGGLASAPIELAGGFGLQRGIDQAANVLERGGTGGEAALAGGVTGAANVAANLLPVKAGGAVGRAIESGLGRGLGARAGQVAGGALTGGAIAAAGDTGLTAASNAALPEGEQFNDLKQEADPALSFGIGAAFGGAAARGARTPAVAQAAVSPAPSTTGPRGATAPAGSVGAAGVEVETARRERAAALPVPLELSKGEAMGPEGKFEQQQFERETAKQDVGAPLREAAAEKNERLLRNLDVMLEDTGAAGASGPDARRQVGEAVDAALSKRIDEAKQRISSAYRMAREAGEMADPVSTEGLVRYLNETGPESINAPVLQTVREKLVQLGGATRDGEGGLIAGAMPLNDLEEVRKMVNRVSDSTATNMTFGREVKNQIDAMTESAGGDLYREARRLRTEYAREVTDRAVVNDLVRKKNADRAIALEDVFDRSVLKRRLDDVRHLHGVLMAAGDEGRQAWRELQGQTLRHIQEQATKNIQRDIRGNQIVSVAGLDRAIRALDDGRLDFIFGKKGAEQLRDLNDVASNVLTSVPGAVNHSNTASSLRAMVVNAIDTMVTFSASGVPVPALAVLKKGVTALRERGVRKRIDEALAQPEGLQAAQGAGRTVFSAETPSARADASQADAAPATAATPTAEAGAGAAAKPASDPRIVEIERLRGATSNPEVHAVLDKHRRDIETELKAQQQQERRASQAEELDALARSSGDADLRRRLAARAEQLRGGEVPTGEARELEPSLAEIERLKGDASPETTKVLDAEAKRRQAIIKAQEDQATKAAEVTSLEDKANETGDPEIRAALLKRADELRGERLPVGEVQDVPTETVEAAPPIEDLATAPDRQDEPVGEFAGYMAAVRRLREGRSVGGSDPDIELTMLQDGAPARGEAPERVGKPQAGGDMKRGPLPAKTFVRPRELEKVLRAKLGGKIIDGLIKRNVISLDKAPADAPRDAQGRFTGTAVELFHDRLDPATAPGVLLHEVGMHYGMEKMLGANRYAELLADVRKMRQRPEVAKAWADVQSNYPEIDERSPAFVSEVAAHLVESSPDRPIVRRMLDGPRAYLYSNFGVNVGRTDPALLRALAVGALRKSAGVEVVSASPAALAVAGTRNTEAVAETQ